MHIRASRWTSGITGLVNLLFLLVLALVFTVPPSMAQTVTGTILGTVKDSGGGAVPSATVTVKNLETGISRSATTDNSGGFDIVSVPAGVYNVTATAQGFKAEVRENQTLTVGAVLRADMTLQIGTVEQQVVVTGEAPQVNTSNATISGLVDDVSIRELPLNGRDWIQLATIQPGVTTLDTASGGGYSGAGLRMFVAGARSTQNAFRVDGLVVNDYSNNSPGNALGINMGVDAIREFTVLTNSFSAEYGRSAGGVVNSVLKSGTNQIHGGGFYFLRNSALDARNYFDPAQIPAFRRNQFGASVGGPIKKDKLFYFADYEGIREFQPASFATNTLSDDARNGLICNNTACTAKHQVTVAASIKPYLALFPHPTQPGPGDTGVFNFAGSAPGTDNYVIGKVDYQLNATNSLSISYNFDQASIDAPDNYNNFKVLNKTRIQRVIFTWQHVFNASVLNTFRAGVNRIHQPQIFDHDGDAVATDPSLAFNPGRTTMGVFSLPFLSTSYTPSGQDVHTREFDFTDPQLIDDVSWVKGRNNFRMGFSFEGILTNILSDSFPAGEWIFNSMSGFIQGLPDQYNSDFPGTDSLRGLRQKVFGAYFVDDFRLKPNLTLNLGIRYEPATVVKVTDGKASFITNLTDGPAQTKIGNPIYSNNTYKNVAPRIGLAWDPFKDGKTSVRAGFGIYDVQLTPALYLLRLDRSYPFYNQGAVNLDALSPNPCANGSCFPKGGLGLLSPTSLFTIYIQQNPPTIYKMQYNLNIQRQIAPTLTLTVGYLGSRGEHLPVNENDIDAVPPSQVTFSNGNYYFPYNPVTGKGAARINNNWSRIQSVRWFGFSKYNA
ncbi:MAG TPA: TonB-dependent receptor, partial [Candidatus Acidoferrales bacterium]|nr:TonB-dependent receptor [Candidatus Acidoferrales bacterium]